MSLLDNNNSSFWNQINQIGQQGNFNAQPQFNYPKPTAITVQTPSLPSVNGAATGTGATGSLEQLMNAVRSQESSGNYSAVNKDSGAAGAYQVMPSNISAWSQAALGHSVSEQEFLKSPQEQDAIARYQLQQYMNKYGVAGAAAAWYGGPGAVSKMYDKTPQNGYPSMYDYVMSILKKYGGN